MYDRHDLRWDGHRLRLRSGRAGARRMTATRMSRSVRKFLKRAALVDRAPLDTRIESYGVVKASCRRAIPCPVCVMSKRTRLARSRLWQRVVYSCGMSTWLQRYETCRTQCTTRRAACRQSGRRRTLVLVARPSCVWLMKG